MTALQSRFVSRFAGRFKNSVAPYSPPALTLAEALLGSETDGLAVDFTDNSMVIRDTATPANAYAGDPFSKLTFSRSSLATMYGSDGLLKYAAHNLILQSQTFDSATWSATSVNKTANATTAPDGTVTADRIVSTASGSAGLQQSVGTSVGSYTYAVSVKRDNTDFVRLACTNNAGSVESAWFDIVNGSVGTTGASLTASISNEGNGWWRCSITRTLASASEIFYIRIAESDNNTNVSAAGMGVYVWGAHLYLNPMHGSYTANSLVTTSAAYHAPRIDYDPVTLQPRGLLMEEARTNLVTYSAELTTNWTTVNTSRTASAGASPDGQSNAVKLAASGTTSVVHQNYQIGKTITSGIAYTASAFLKAAEYSWGIINIYDTTDTDRRCYFNLATGAIGTLAGGCTATIQSVGNGWYRCTVTKTSAATSGGISIEFSNADFAPTFSAVVGSGILMWGAQYEAGSFATSYIPTTTASVTRAAETCSIAKTLFNHNATDVTLFAAFRLVATTGLQTALAMQGGSFSTTMAIGYNSSEQPFGYVESSQASFAGSAQLEGNHKIAMGVATNNVALFNDGSQVGATDTSATAPTVTTLHIGARNASADPANGHIRQIMHLPRRMSNAELQALTT